MDVIFQPSRGSPFNIEVGYFDTVLDIKEKIQKHQGIPISKQTLIFNGNILQDDFNVHNSHILDGSRIDLLLKIQLLLRMPSTRNVALEMDVHETIRRLKEKIQELELVPINQLAIHANGIELDDDKSMQDCELSDNSEIDVAVRSSPVTTTSNMNIESRKLRIFVLNHAGTQKMPVEVNSSDNVVELRKKLRKLKMDVPKDGYFFIYKQDVMDDDRSFSWHNVCQGDTIEVFRGRVSGG
ncbi:UNVERIFIED_CONTAM: Ubiquitin domain-containing protein 7SL RNA1 [Sesamum latifolium]|uniref:Ubiquitin domain-containing protein 7SL RNA1 n=1 Tax=Sesamum latifolium TaxID=2727402 RepID=A0AAW2YFH6_9LAMI